MTWSVYIAPDLTGGPPSLRVVLGILTFALCAFALSFAAPVQAAPGDLDASFSDDGKLTTDFGRTDEGQVTAVQADGKIVVAGSAYGSTANDFAVARYNADGSPDASFGDNGKVTTDFPTDFGDGGNDRAVDLAVQSNGKIVVVGYSSGDAYASDFAVARYNPDGSLDTTFSDDGKQTTDVAAYDTARGIALEPDEQDPQGDAKVVVVGHYECADDWGGCGSAFALVRYNADGSLDGSFADGGRQTTDLGGYDEARDVTVESGGKVVVAGRSGGDFALVHYKADGSLDTTFSGDGKHTADFGERTTVTDVAFQAEGKMVATGWADHIAYGDDIALARYDADGSLDTTFSGDGLLETDIDRIDVGRGVTVQDDGAIVVAGYVTWWEGGTDFALLRYTSDGSLDSTFSGDGKLTTDFGGSDSAAEVALQDDGKIVTAGSNEGATAEPDFAVARYHGGKPQDEIPPVTSITSGPMGTVRSTSASFGFSSSEPDSTFECRLDGGGWSACDSPKDYSSLGQGGHTFEVVATDAAGNRDATPAMQSWTVDTVAPEVTAVSPSGDATGVSPTANVLATFSEDMRASTISRATVKLVPKGGTTPVAATVAYDSSTKRAKLDPSNPLKRGATYVATVTTEVEDLAGNPMSSAKTWAFTVRR